MKLFVTGGSGFIGVNALDYFSKRGIELVNFDLRLPINHELIERNGITHLQGDILDARAVAKALSDSQPDWVLHLAARADCDENTTVEEGYRPNTDGTANVLAAIRDTKSVSRCIITSSQYVCRPGYQPQHDSDYNPETVYGRSKAISEDLTRAAGLACCWTIIRPTNIWGPWHLRYRRQVWRSLQRGFYRHPGHEHVIRTYGYVGNVVHQIERIFTLPSEQVHGRTLNLGDPPLDLIKWVNGFSQALRGRDVTVVSRPVMRSLAQVGDWISALRGREFLLTSSRYRSMITEYITRMEDTFALLGPNPISLEQGIEQTVQWLRAYQPGDGLRF